jgi:CBS domain containing-hemolysin-like protein
MSTVIIIVLIVAFLVLANGLYVAAEFASVSARKTRLAQLAGSGHRLARLMLPIVEDSARLDSYIATSQVGITISSLVLGAYGQNVVAMALAPLLTQFGSLAEGVAYSISATGVLIALTVLQVVLGELFPKSVAILYPERTAIATVLPMQWSYAIFRPFIWLLNGSGNLILKWLGANHSEEHRYIHSPEEIELLVSQSHEGGLLDDEAQQMLRNTLRLRELTARQVMVPRTRLVAAPVESSVADLIDKACSAGYTRIPVYRTTVDDIVGFGHIKDLFKLNLAGEQNLTAILRDVIYVPESLPIADVWATLNTKRQYIAIVFDEFGGTAGLITFEDLIEEIFGELQDEFDDELPLVSADKEGRIYLRGDLLVTDCNEYLDLNLPESEADTLGGLVFSHLGRVPRVGDEVVIGTPGIEIRVEAMESLGVAEVSLQLPVEVTENLGEWEVAEHD